MRPPKHAWHAAVLCITAVILPIAGCRATHRTPTPDAPEAGAGLLLVAHRPVDWEEQPYLDHPSHWLALRRDGWFVLTDPDRGRWDGRGRLVTGWLDPATTEEIRRRIAERGAALHQQQQRIGSGEHAGDQIYRLQWIDASGAPHAVQWPETGAGGEAATLTAALADLHRSLLTRIAGPLPDDMRPSIPRHLRSLQVIGPEADVDTPQPPSP